MISDEHSLDLISAKLLHRWQTRGLANGLGLDAYVKRAAVVAYRRRCRRWHSGRADFRQPFGFRVRQRAPGR